MRCLIAGYQHPGWFLQFRNWILGWFLSCNTISCDNTWHNKHMDHFCSALIECVILTADDLMQVIRPRDVTLWAVTNTAKTHMLMSKKNYLERGSWHMSWVIFEAMKSLTISLWKDLKTLLKKNHVWKKESLLAEFRTKKFKIFWEKVLKIKGSTNSSHCNDETLKFIDVVMIFDRIYNLIFGKVSIVFTSCI